MLIDIIVHDHVLQNQEGCVIFEPIIGFSLNWELQLLDLVLKESNLAIDNLQNLLPPYFINFKWHAMSQ